MTNREKEIELINKTQDEYENILVDYLLKPNSHLKTINFTSPTGTGKTKMMADVIEKMDSSLYFFVITTLSKGQLKLQIDSEVRKYTSKSNVLVYGLNDYTKSTKIQEEDIVALLPINKKIIWFRDEGHINTNRWSEILNERSDKIVNFSATNNRDSEDDIRCNFNHTMMLRTVKQQEGTPKDAINKLLEVKKQHEKVKKYNPCAIFRILDDSLLDEVIGLCKKNNLKWIDITEEEYIMKEICEDDNEYDVIINKFKIVEGIDIRRAHVLYMTNEPKNPATTIQVIGRCRRNALLYRNDIDILDSTNKKLLENTRICYVFYNIKGMRINEDIYGDLVSTFCDTISVEQLKQDIQIKLNNGYLKNGLKILESTNLDGKSLSGTFEVKKDKKTGFNILYSNNVKITFYDNHKHSSKYKMKSYFINCGGIMSDDELYSSHRYNYMSTSVPLCEVKNNWMINETNDGIFYCNYGDYILKAKCFINLSDIKEKTKKILERNYNLSVICNRDGTYSISLRYDSGYSYVHNCFSSSYSFFNIELNNFCDQTKKTNFKEKEQAEKQLEIIDKRTIITFLNAKKIWFSIPYSVNNDNDDSITIDDRMFDYAIYKKYVGTTYLYGKNIIFNYDYNNYRLYAFRYRNDNNICYMDKEIIAENNESSDNYVLLFDIKVNFSQPNYNQLRVYEKELNYCEMNYFDYNKKINDKESAILGGDLMKFISSKSINSFIEDSAVTSKISKYTKFKIFLLNKYSNILDKCSSYYFYDKNKFPFSKTCNSMLGYLVEYYVKYLLYGTKYLNRYIFVARKEAKVDVTENDIVIRACMLKYKELMVDAFGTNTASILGSKMIKVDKLVEEQYSTFKETIINLAENCISIVRDNIKVYENNFMHSPNLSINHISGLADLIDEETIMDIKCTSTINEKSILQLLGYYYLSTKRSDLNIKYLMVLDVATKRYIKINIDTCEIITNYEGKV